MNKDHESQRKELWINAWVAVANSNSSYRIGVPTEWADRALSDFDDRFKEKAITQPDALGEACKVIARLTNDQQSANSLDVWSDARKFLKSHSPQLLR